MFKYLLVIFLIIGITYGLSPIKKTSCVISMNDKDEGCDIHTDPAPDNDNLVARKILGTNEAMYYRPESCSMDMDTMMGKGVVKVTYTPEGGAQIVNKTICSTVACQNLKTQSAVVDWINKYPKGTTQTCYYSTTDTGRVFLETGGFCSYRGTFSETANTCTCTGGATGDSCDNAAQVEPSNNLGSSSAIPSIVMSVLGLIVLATLM
ncbi:hypothetical protein CYY_006098 [Polysphondylium violaceum]|uniref:EGF-like domain-containing protein n=1 Tax=Polysphondylium violaceum TaxID=133409 RepID=A0A8J4PT74_9MYCE|nr:hypothetical protein CYY_006098 [Polysphondylium violaceum]